MGNSFNQVVAGNKAVYDRISFNLAPGAEAEKNISGQFIYCVDSNRGFEFSMDDGRPIESDIGIEYRQINNELFTKIRVRNNNAVALNCSFLYGFGEIIDRRLVPVAGRRVGVLIQDFPTQYLGSGLTSIAATSTEDFDGNPTGDQIQRKQIVITNLEALGGNFLQINDSSSNVGRVVLPQQTISIDTDDFVQIENTTGSAISCRVDEIWYTNA